MQFLLSLVEIVGALVSAYSGHTEPGTRGQCTALIDIFIFSVLPMTVSLFNQNSHLSSNHYKWQGRVTQCNHKILE